MLSFFMLAVIAVLILLIHRINGLKRRIDSLEQRMIPSTSSAVESPATPKPSPAKTPIKPAQATHPPKPQKPSRTRAEWEALVGGKVLNRIGALAIIIGAGFFLKYSFDNNWITETMRVVIGAVVGIGLLAAALHYQKKKLPIFAQGLAGAGLSILYLSIYASFNFYHLLPQIAAFGFMAVVTALALALAMRFDALAVSVLGWAGGYLTPFMLSTGTANETGLFSYILLLQVSLLLIAARKSTWTILPPLTVTATYAVFYAWYSTDYTQNDLFLTILFITLFWGVFFAYEQYSQLRTSSVLEPLTALAALLNICGFYSGLYLLLYNTYYQESAFATLGLALIYLLAMLILMRKKPQMVPAIRQQAVIAMILTGIATAIHFSDFMVPTMWAIEGVLLVYAGLRSQLSYVRSFGVFFLLIAGYSIVAQRSGLAFYPIEDFHIFFTTRFAAYLTLATALAVSATLLRRSDAARHAQLIKWLGFGFCTVVFFMLTVETLDAFEKTLHFLRKLSLQSQTIDRIRLYENMQKLTLSGIWLLYSVALMAAGLWRRIAGWRIAAMVLFGISILKVFVYDLSFLDTVYRIISFISLGVILLTVSYLYQKYKDTIFQK